MSGERYADLAVASTALFLGTYLPTQLRAVESATSMSTNALENPAIVPSLNPFSNASPVIEVYDVNGGYDSGLAGFRQRLQSIGLELAIKVVGDADRDALETRGRRYLTGVLQTFEVANAAGIPIGTGVKLTEMGEWRSHQLAGDQSMTRVIYVIPIRVAVHSPETP